MDTLASSRGEIELMSISLDRPMHHSYERKIRISQVHAVPLPYKRVFDVIFAFGLAIGILSWVYPIVFVLIKLTSKGPVLFRQKRAGLNGRIFNCIKFRTMYLNDFADTAGAIPNDKRITPVGRWLRKTCIDELPQVINVLAGDMSIVGPRPHMMKHHNQFSGLLPEYEFRHAVKPGITGLSQIRGFHGSIMNYHCIHGRTRLDLFYIRRASLWLDVWIVFRTAGILIKPLKPGR